MTELAADSPEYFQAIARARYVVRKSFRIVDEQAKKLGLEPLQHQALIQAYGASDGLLRVNEIADRLDIAPAFASRLIRDLESLELVGREASPTDKRITLVAVTDKGARLLEKISHEVHVHIEYFHRQLTDEERADALSVFAFYVGVPLTTAQLDEVVRLSSASR